MDGMEEMIKKEVSRIGDLKERVAFKDIIEQVFLSLYEANQEMYRALEHRVMDDLAPGINHYRICVGVAEREYVDRSHHLLAPIREEDLMEPGYDAAALGRQLEEEGECYAMTLFMACDYLQLQGLLQQGPSGGRILTEKAAYPAEYVFRMNTSYLEEVAHLYEVFTSNGIPWQTVNAPYLYKFVDVYLTGGVPQVPPGEAVTGFEPELGEYREWAHGNYVPLWNIRRLSLESVGFPVPCEDRKNYEHIISIRDYGMEHVYLIDDGGRNVKVRQMEERLYVTGDEPEARKWQVYMIRSGQNRRFERFPCPVMANQREDEFVERFFRRQGVRVKTASELDRFIRGYGLEGYVQYEGYALTDHGKDVPETYSMNSFIIDEIRENGYRRCLLLKFRRRGEAYPFLQRDIMSFLVSEVQMLYPEYLCEGELL